MIEQNTFTIIFAVFLLFTCRDMFFGQSASGADSDPAKAAAAADHLHPSAGLDIDSHMAGPPYGVPTIKIQYCHSCGYRQAFDEISKLLQSRFPGIIVEGEIHQPNWFRSQIVNLIFISKIAVLAMIYMEYNPFTYLQMPTPSVWTFLSTNKVSSSLLIMFFANSIESNMLSTGAFEIFYNDNMPIWSKLQTGRMPTGPELLQIVGSQYNFLSKSKMGEFVPT